MPTGNSAAQMKQQGITGTRGKAVNSAKATRPVNKGVKHTRAAAVNRVPKGC